MEERRLRENIKEKEIRKGTKKNKRMTENKTTVNQISEIKVKITQMEENEEEKEREKERKRRCRTTENGKCAANQTKKKR